MPCYLQLPHAYSSKLPERGQVDPAKHQRSPLIPACAPCQSPPPASLTGGVSIRPAMERSLPSERHGQRALVDGCHADPSTSKPFPPAWRGAPLGPFCSVLLCQCPGHSAFQATGQDGPWRTLSRLLSPELTAIFRHHKCPGTQLAVGEWLKG